ncbi:MAG: glycosyltransferase family 4 protein, partial [Thermoleophilia bacterium]|nr:glycosyltransferase family 4 protein [Thermoleophilia bacterium]
GAGYDIDLVWVTAQPPARPAGTVYVRPEQHVLRELYRGATVFVSGSHYEAFSLPPLEAMACGCPVVTTANAGVLEYAVDGQNCLLAEIGNPQSLAEQVMRLLDEPQLRQRISRGGLETANRYRWENIIPALRGFYEEVAEFEPVARNSIEDWEIDATLFSDPDWVARLLAKPLLHAEADAILAPIIYDDLVEKHPVARWEIVARRKRPCYGRNYE